LGVVESTHTRIQPSGGTGEIWVQCINSFPESVNLPSGSTLGQFQSVQEATGSPQQHPSEGRRTTPPHAGTRGRYWANGVGNGERRVKAKLLHQYSEIPHQGDLDGSLNRAARREVSMVAGTALTQQTTRKKGRGSPQFKPDKQDSREAEHDRNQGRLQQRAGMPPEVSQHLCAKSFWPQGATTPLGKLFGGGSRGVPSQTRKATTQ